MAANQDNHHIYSTLQGDCENCFGMCCVALPFAASSDFAMNKEAGKPCQNLREDFRCGVHSSLRERGFRGCTVYDCFGAGQKVSQMTGGKSQVRRSKCSRYSRLCGSFMSCCGT